MIERSEGQGIKPVVPQAPKPPATLAPRQQGEAKGPLVLKDAKAVTAEGAAAAGAALRGQTDLLTHYGDLPAAGTTPKQAPQATTPGSSTEGTDTNALDETGARPAVNIVAGVANGGDVLKDVATYGTVVREVGSKASFLSRLFEPVARLLDGAANVASKVPGLMPACSFLGKVAPVLGIAVAGLDITRAALEPDPVKKQRYQGQAVMSSVGALAGVVAFAGFTGAAIFGVAVAPVAIPIAIGVGITLGLVSVADEFLNGGKIASAIGGGLQKAGAWLGGLFS